MTMLEMVVMLMHLALSNNNSGKDKLQTKIYVLTVSVLIVVTLLFSYNFVFKPEVPYLNNGGATLWDTQTEELADEICSDCDTDEEKVKAIYEWMIHNFEYDYGYTPMVQYFNVHQTIETRKGICYDFSHLFAALCRSQNIPCYVVDGDKRNNAQYHHTWNRVYFDGSWWNIDVTFDIVQTKKQEQLYWFRKIINPYAQDKEYQITKIY
ncbi:MAG: transglutaminase domain-containing protein [Clostridia bacterium]|nr:transglutaminase domain-containing protein [Clostridia bacterium]